MDYLQSIPRDSNEKDVVAMLDELTIDLMRNLVIVLEHDGNDVSITEYRNQSSHACKGLKNSKVFLVVVCYIIVCLFVFT